MKRIKAISIIIGVILAEMLIYTLVSVFTDKLSMNEILSQNMLIRNIIFVVIYNPVFLLYYYLRRNSSERHRKNFNKIKKVFKDIYQ